MIPVNRQDVISPSLDSETDGTQSIEKVYYARITTATMNPNNESLITFPSVTTELEAALIVYLLVLAVQEIDATQSERLTSQFQAEAWGLSRSWCCRIRGLLPERSSQKTILWTHDTNRTTWTSITGCSSSALPSCYL